MHYKGLLEMAMHDVDKQNDNRANPILNVEDKVAVRMAHNTQGNTYRTAGLDVKQRMAFKNGLIITYDSQNRASSVYGYIPEISSIPLFIIAKDGYDVFTDILGISAPSI